MYSFIRELHPQIQKNQKTNGQPVCILIWEAWTAQFFLKNARQINYAAIPKEKLNSSYLYNNHPTPSPNKAENISFHSARLLLATYRKQIFHWKSCYIKGCNFYVPLSHFWFIVTLITNGTWDVQVVVYHFHYPWFFSMNKQGFEPISPGYGLIHYPLINRSPAQWRENDANQN